MPGAFDRTVALIGEERFDRLRRARVIVVGLGGVGGAAAEVLARSGIGELTLVDGDKFEPSNLNRQILCTTADIEKYKAEVACERMLAVSPEMRVRAENVFFSSETADMLGGGFDYCIDAIDDIRNKVLLICECANRNIPIISAMGAGNRVDCTFGLTDIFKTTNDPFARKMRSELRRVGIDKLDVVCAVAPPTVKSNMPLSLAAPPLVMGAIMANHVVRVLTGL